MQDAVARGLDAPDENNQDLVGLNQANRDFLGAALTENGQRPIKPKGSKIIIAENAQLGIAKDVDNSRKITPPIGESSPPAQPL